MTHDETFVTELRNGFANLAKLINERISALDSDIETQVGIIANAYGEIKADKAELSAIAEVVSDFVHDMGGVADDAKVSIDDADTVVSDMFDLVYDGYIDDPDIEIIDCADCDDCDCECADEISEEE